MKDFVSRVPKALRWVIIICLLALISYIPRLFTQKSADVSVQAPIVSPSPSISDADIENFCASLKDKLSDKYPKSTIEYSTGSDSFSIRAFVVNDEEIQYGQQLCRDNSGVDATWQEVKDYLSEISGSLSSEIRDAGFQNCHNEICLCSEEDVINYIDTRNDDFFKYLVVIDGQESFDFVFDYIPDSFSVQSYSGAVTVGMENALRSAYSYLQVSAFSHVGLYDQLLYEGYTESEAAYACQNCGADWKEQAVISAQNYLKISAFSFSELVDQLEYEGFSQEEAEYGASIAYR